MPSRTAKPAERRQFSINYRIYDVIDAIQFADVIRLPNINDNNWGNGKTYGTSLSLCNCLWLCFATLANLKFKGDLKGTSKEP